MITITKVLDTASNFVKVLRYGLKDVNTPEISLPYGIDSKPIKNKRAIVASTQRKGKNVALGYIYESSVTESGETRIYATNDDGIEQFSIHLKKDGTCEIGGSVDNIVRYSELATQFNELQQKHNEILTLLQTWVVAPNDGGLALKTAALLLTPSIADITHTKVDEVKIL